MEKLKGILLVLYAVALSNASVIKENTNKATKGVNFESGKATEICARIGSDGILVAHEHCTRFYKCAEGRPVALKCPPNLLYNPSNEQCDWPHNVECGDRTIPEDDDDVDSESDNGSGGNGNENDNTGNGHADPSLATEICAEKDSDGVLVAHEHCTRFYKCFDSHPVALICPPNLLYNPNNEQCDWPHNVECGERTIPEDDEDVDSESDNGSGGNGNENDNTGNGHADPSLATEICAEKDSDGVLVAHEHCTRFYKCFDSHPVALICPPNLLYNPNNEQCDWPHNVECGDRTIPEDDEDVDSESDNGSGGNGNENDNTGNGHADPSLATEICAEKDSDGVLVAHEHCTRFYKCFDSHPVALICPPNLLYNPNNEQCDWPHNVECGDRTIPEDDEDVDSESDNGNGGNGNENENTGNGHADPSLATEICAEKDSDGVLVAHEHCTRFYKCFDSHPVALICPPNLLYNPNNEQCDWPHNVECGDRTIPEDDEDIDSESDNGNGGNGNENDNTGNGHADPSLATEICAENDSDGVLVAHEHCTRFYKCFNSRPVALVCPPNLLYNPSNEQCDWPHNVECGDRTIPEDDEDIDSESDNGNGGNGNENKNTGNGHADPSLATEICAEKDSDGVLVAHEHCTRFYKCFDSHPVALICPPNLLYNPNNEQCDWPHNVECGDRTIPEDDEDIDSESDNGNGGNGNENDNTGNGHADPSLATEICAENDSDGVLVAHEHCTRFYKCFNSRPVALVCPPNLLYNPSNEQCDWPHNVECGDRTIPEDDEDIDSESDSDNGGNGNENDSTGNGHADPSLATEICAENDSDGVLVAHEHCTRFYKCFNSRPVALICPPNLLYNPSNEQCDWPHNVECGDRTIPESDEDEDNNDASDGNLDGNDNEGNDNSSGNCDPSAAPTLCAQTGSDSVLIAHENCDKFYICWNHKPVVLSCPPNLLYNPSKEECDWPQNVDCGSRIIP